jgi:DNA-binding MarR family transcriptional regulator/GNAT superfamily N-acetyltransferase
MSEKPPHLLSGLRKAYRLFDRFNADVDRKMPTSELVGAQRRILLELRQLSGRSDIQIAAALGMNPTQFSRLVNKLVADGLVRTESAPGRKYPRRLYLAEGGRDFADELNIEFDTALEDGFQSMPPTLRHSLFQAAMHVEMVPSEPEGDSSIVARSAKRNEYPGIVDAIWSAASGAGGTSFAAMALEGFVALLRIDPLGHDDPGFVADAWIAMQSGKPVGACFLNVDQKLDIGIMAIVWVDPSVRRRGAGSDLLDSCIRRAKRRELFALETFCSNSDPVFKKTLKKAGFVRSADREERLLTPGTMWSKYSLGLPTDMLS